MPLASLSPSALPAATNERRWPCRSQTSRSQSLCPATPTRRSRGSSRTSQQRPSKKRSTVVRNRSASSISEVSRAQGTTKQRGYGAKHKAYRRRWAAEVAAGEVCCARCGHFIVPGEPWDLDHTPDRTGYLGPSHARCNRATAKHAARRRRRTYAAYVDSSRKTSRVW
jgi:hypothetical protein